MLLIQNIRLSRILRNTWHVDLIMIASCTAAYFIRAYLIAHHFEIPSIIPTVLGTAIAFFIGFNNNQAYDRWWEARILWGAIVNDSRSLARQIMSFVDSPYASEEVDVVESIVHQIPVVIPVAGAALIFLLAFIAVSMA